MATDAPTAMPTDAHILTLAQWFSPAYPVGAFSYSHGLEAAAEAGDVTDATSLHRWIADVLRFGTGHADALFIAAAYHAPDNTALDEINATARAFAPSAERLRETDLQGAAFCKITAEVWDTQTTAMAYPVAVGHAARVHGMPLALTTSIYLHAFAANLVAAGQRLAPVGQSQAQKITRALALLCLEIAQDTGDGDLGRLTSTAYLTDIASMHHETKYARIFQT
ncbi:Urease accessory protein UreF [Sulfitobacter noctilucae]|uniref:urease accessory protein UreF n=1 Tax=Sulfitobacter noctilucae TaxID=1342302 RepID=UPI000B216541|nr:urease accessory UreF family protein [Sulfitobacter noctilucae]KIN61800.1 Urease accessory protein UreF [Sulfitobacter noctilucae]